MPQRKINVVIWDTNNNRAYTFKRAIVLSDPHYMVVRISGAEHCYIPSCGLDIGEIDMLPRDAREITIHAANTLSLEV